MLSTINFGTGLTTLPYIKTFAPRILILPPVQVRSTVFKCKAAVILVAVIVPVYPADVNAVITDSAPFAVVCAVFADVVNVASCVAKDDPLSVMDDVVILFDISFPAASTENELLLFFSVFVKDGLLIGSLPANLMYLM